MPLNQEETRARREKHCATCCSLDLKLLDTQGEMSISCCFLPVLKKQLKDEKGIILPQGIEKAQDRGFLISPALRPHSLKVFGKYGGDDGTRTRDLCRDRAAF